MYAIRSYYDHRDVPRAIAKSIASAGKGVLITALTLITSVVLWSMSSLRRAGLAPVRRVLLGENGKASHQRGRP